MIANATALKSCVLPEQICLNTVILREMVSQESEKLFDAARLSRPIR